ncbi:MAG TPA: isochorismate synthase, partial [Solirubrobacteraceae bacterium]|nr:isochorismate synthase [Solirubrobacteraceae bacterium]
MLGTGSSSVFSLGAGARERLSECLALAVSRARRSGEGALAALSLPLDAGVDPSAVAASSRGPGEPWFVFEQPDRGRTALAGLGQAACLQAAGGERFASVGERWRALSAGAVHEQLEGCEGAAPVAVGGFAFAPDGGGSPHWAGFEPASMIVPEVAIARATRGGVLSVRMTLAALAEPDDLAEELLGRLERRLERLSARGLPLLDPSPAGRFQVASAMPP